MRLLVMLSLVACGGGASSSGEPAAGIASRSCERLGPDGTGFLLEAEFGVTLDVGQAFEAIGEFPTTDAPVNVSPIFSCGGWSNTGLGRDSRGCQRDAGQPGSTSVGLSLAIEFPSPLSPPVTATVTARVVTAPASTTIVAMDTDTTTCN